MYDAAVINGGVGRRQSRRTYHREGSKSAWMRNSKNWFPPDMAFTRLDIGRMTMDKTLTKPGSLLETDVFPDHVTNSSGKQSGHISPLDRGSVCVFLLLFFSFFIYGDITVKWKRDKTYWASCLPVID